MGERERERDRSEKPAPAPEPEVFSVRMDDPYVTHAMLPYADAVEKERPELAARIRHRAGLALVEKVPSLWRLPTELMRGPVARALDVQAEALTRATGGRIQARVVTTSMGTSYSCRTTLMLSGLEAPLVSVECSPPVIAGRIHALTSEFFDFKTPEEFVVALAKAVNHRTVQAQVLMLLQKSSDTA